MLRKVLFCCLKVSEFKLQSCYYVHFGSNTLAYVMNPIIHPAISQVVSLLFFYKDKFEIKLPKEKNI